ncbi:MAG: TolB family protein [Actinomycetota bacterium]
MKIKRVVLIVLAVAMVAFATLSAGAVAFQTRRATINSSGTGADADSWNVDLSAGGRFVAFGSDATNLVPGDTNGYTDAFVHDFTTGKTTRVSVRSNGNQADQGDPYSGYYAVAISATGRYVAFDSGASDLVAGDTNTHYDVFVHDRTTGKTERVSVRSNGNEGNGESYYNVDISADGRFVTFSSDATNLVPGDTNGATDVFVRDRQTGKTTRVSVRSNGNEGNDASGAYALAMTADGRFITFDSTAATLVGGDTNGYPDIFVHDRSTGKTTRVSVRSNGNQGNASSRENADLSSNGRFVTFSSDATNLVTGDANGFMDVFLHDRQTGKTTLVSVRTNGNQANDDSGFGTGGYYDTMLRMSADGRYVAFASNATNLITGDTNGYMDVFVHDRTTGTTRRASVRSNGSEGNNGSGEYGVAMTRDGRFVGYASYATNLAPGDNNGAEYDIYVSGPLH